MLRKRRKGLIALSRAFLPMVHLSGVALLLLHSHLIMAQQSHADEFLEDSLYFHSLNDSVHRYWKQSPEKAEELVNILMAFAKKKSKKTWEAQAFINLAYSLQIKADEESLLSSIEQFNKALTILKEKNNLKLQIDCYNGLSLSYKYLNNFPEAVQYSLKCIDLLKSAGNHISTARHGIAYRSL